MIRKLLLGVLIVIALLVGAAFVLKPKPIPAAAIRDSVVRTPALIERAWQLPAAAALRHRLDSQSNPSVCGPSRSSISMSGGRYCWRSRRR